MRRLLIALLSLMTSACVVERARGYPAPRPPEPLPAPITQDAVLRLVKAGVSDDIILEKIKADGVASHPTSDQIVSLKKEGVSDRVIEALISARVPAPYEIAPPPRVVYRNYVYADPWWPWIPWWCGWGPYGHLSWSWSYRH